MRNVSHRRPYRLGACGFGTDAASPSGRRANSACAWCKPSRNSSAVSRLRCIATLRSITAIAIAVRRADGSSRRMQTRASRYANASPAWKRADEWAGRFGRTGGAMRQSPAARRSNSCLTASRDLRSSASSARTAHSSVESVLSMLRTFDQSIGRCYGDFSEIRTA